jgi:serine/threonine protein kinase
VACYKSASEEFSTENTNSVTEKTHYGSAAEDLWSELHPEDPSLREQAYYGSAPEHLWSDLQLEDSSRCVDSVNEDERFRFPRRIDPSKLEIGEEIAVYKGPRHMYAWANTSSYGGKQDVAVKRYKDRGVDAEQLKRRMAKVLMEGSFGLCSMFGLSEDNTRGEVSVVMEARRGDLRNLIDFRIRYLKSQMRSMKKNGAEMMMISFSYGSTLSMMHQIA